MEGLLWETTIQPLQAAHLRGAYRTVVAVAFAGTLILFYPIWTALGRPYSALGTPPLIALLLLLLLPCYQLLAAKKLNIWIIVLALAPLIILGFTAIEGGFLRPLAEAFAAHPNVATLLLSAEVAAMLATAIPAASRVAAAAGTPVAVYRSRLRAGTYEIAFASDPLTVHVSEHPIPAYPDFYPVKLTVRWGSMVAGPALISGVLQGIPQPLIKAAGSGVALGSYQRSRHANVVNCTLPLSREQLIGFLMSLNAASTNIKVNDWTRGSSPTITGLVRTRAVDEPCSTTINVYPRSIAGT